MWCHEELSAVGGVVYGAIGGATSISFKCLLWARHNITFRQRPYRVEYTGSLPNSEVKRHRARLVLGWGTAWEDLRVLLAFCIVHKTRIGL